ncbi:MAG: glutamine--fructose-6-phosphate transaminase (isomerizing) [Actinobacteria bacterium]|nr:glutamine--fructose-6-phosphate transaminase (isomerizing) [Actinomycetota bacterium]
MCGIIGYVGTREAKPLLIGGLERLEYRGYDSAGISVVERGGLETVRAVGQLDNLKDAAADFDGDGATTGVGHTRWATHGRVSEENAHPLSGCRPGELGIVLNGIVENFIELRATLADEGHTFASETDAEVVAHLIERAYSGDLVAAVRHVYGELEGHFAFVVTHRDHPDLLVGARLQCPLVVGIAEGETFIASSIAAFLAETRCVKLIEEGEVVAVTREGARFLSLDGVERLRDALEIDWDDESAEKHGYETFMLKEIYEQPAAVAATLAEHVEGDDVRLDSLGLSDEELRGIGRILVLAAGTAYHAAVVGRYLVEEWAQVPYEFDIASEWRYRNAVLTPDTLVIGVSQSGETRDTIHALRVARERGARTVGITNLMGTQITREVDSVLYTRAGMEVGVAATKTFTAQVALFYLLALKLAQVRGTLPPEEVARLVGEVRRIPERMSAFLDGRHPIEEFAQRHYEKPFFFYLGRHIGLPVCLEGALKLKEISYIPTEAYSAGEMKHGPIALLDEATPVVCVATDSHVYDKIVSNIQEVRARGAQVIAVATDGNEGIQHHADDVIYVPRTHPFLQAPLAVVPLQLLAYRIARLRGMNVDQPRNLAKTVTVE